MSPEHSLQAAIRALRGHDDCLRRIISGPQDHAAYLPAVGWMCLRGCEINAVELVPCLAETSELHRGLSQNDSFGRYRH
jgi:hypothetical protein